MKTIREGVWTVHYTRVVWLIRNWEDFEVEGTIGDCELHQATMAYLNARGLPMTAYEPTMREFAFEAYRRMAKELS